MIILKDLLKKIKENTTKGSKSFYKPLTKEESAKIRQYYIENVAFDVNGSTQNLYNKNGTLIAKGYNRIVIGDYGAYIEIMPEQIALDNIKNKWLGKPKRPVKYIWMISKDRCQTKIYYQIAKVSYADYVPGRYYVSPQDVE